MSDEGSPWLWIIAGPNGSGKTTFALDFLIEHASGAEFINVDDIARRTSDEHRGHADVLAARTAIGHVRERLTDKNSFAVETTLSGHSHRRWAIGARRSRWKIGFVYLWIGSPELAKRRVADRVAAGGHDIPDSVIERRFWRGLAHLRWFIDFSDRASIYDNRGERPRLVLAKDGSDVTIHDRQSYASINAIWTDE